MPLLVDMPSELLELILWEVGGSYLRRGKGVGAARLCVCRKWFAAAMPVFLSGLDKTEIEVYGHNICNLDHGHGNHGQRKLMHKNTKKLSIRLVGHFWDRTRKQREADHDNDDADGVFDFWRSADEAPPEWRLHRQWGPLEEWRDQQLKVSLDSIFEEFTSFSVLEDFIFEASSDLDGTGTSWNYIYADTIYQMLDNLPLTHSLRSLTLDLGGLQSGLLDTGSKHLCDDLAAIIPQIEEVRLRLLHVCPRIFAADLFHVPQVRLMWFTLKLHKPSSLDGNDHSTRSCPQVQPGLEGEKLCQLMAKESQSFLSKLSAGCTSNTTSRSHQIEGFRISTVSDNRMNIEAVDILAQKWLAVPEEFFCWEDCGAPCWFEYQERLLSLPMSRN